MPALAVVGVGKAGIRNLAFSLFADLKGTAASAPAPFPDRIAES